MTTNTNAASAEDLQDAVSKALRQAWQLGQTYWQQADSEYTSQHRKADETQGKFDALVEETRAALASAAHRQAPAPAAVAEPVAWLHDDPQRYDVIHAEVKDLLVKSRDAAGYLHRPLDKSAHYTIPLYTAPHPAAHGNAAIDAASAAKEGQNNG